MTSHTAGAPLVAGRGALRSRDARLRGLVLRHHSRKRVPAAAALRGQRSARLPDGAHARRRRSGLREGGRRLPRRHGGRPRSGEPAGLDGIHRHLRSLPCRVPDGDDSRRRRAGRPGRALYPDRRDRLRRAGDVDAAPHHPRAAREPAQPPRPRHWQLRQVHHAGARWGSSPASPCSPAAVPWAASPVCCASPAPWRRWPV